MKNLFLLLPIITLAFLISCNGTEAQNSTINYNYKTKIMKNIYYLNYVLSGNFEIFMNGVSLTRNTKSGVIMNYIYLNPYIAKNGKQTVTLKLKSLDNSKFLPQNLEKVQMEIYSSINKAEPPTKKLHILQLPKYNESQDSILFTWSFEADVPFEINTLDDALDLTKEDPQKLIEEVANQYQLVHTLINEGKINDYMLLYKKSRERDMISMYYDENKQKEYLKGIEQRTQSSKGYMQPIADYKLLLHPNNKIVSLVNSDGKTPLYSLDDHDNIKYYVLNLYRSSKTGQLEVY